MENTIYHFISPSTGEVQENLFTIIRGLPSTLKMFRKNDIIGKIAYIFVWKYSRQGF